MVTTKDVTKPYWAVKKPTPVNHELLNRLLGLAVVDLADPLGKNYRPDRPLKPRDAIDNLYPEGHAEMKDYEKVLKRVDRASARVAFQTVVEACLSAMKDKGSTLKAPHMRRIDMDNAYTRITNLLRAPGTALVPADAEPGLDQPVTDEVVVKQGASDATRSWQSWQSWQSWLFLWLFWATALFGIGPNPNAQRKAEQEQNRLEYRKQVLELLRQEKRVGIVNSIITACDLTMLSGATTKGRAAAGGGTTGPIHAHVRGEVEHIRDVGEQGTYVGEYLIACSYLPLALNPASSTESGRKRIFRYFSRAAHSAQQDAEWTLGMQEIWELGQNEISGDTARLLHAGTPVVEEAEDADSVSEEIDIWIKGTEEVTQDDGDSAL